MRWFTRVMNQKQEQYFNRFDRNILRLFGRALRLGFLQISPVAFYIRAWLIQRQGIKRRARQLRDGLKVPPLLIFSLTRRCNLNCRGCYSKILHAGQDEEIRPERFNEILNEAQGLGISIVMLAGGEPLLRRDMLEIAARHKRAIYPVFTNGTLLDEGYLRFFSRNRHLIPVISLEGADAETDARRGAGIFAGYRKLLPQLMKTGVFWGLSFTVNKQNFHSLISEELIREFIKDGCRLFFFVEYVPVQTETNHLALDAAQKIELTSRTEKLSRKYPGLFIAFPGDEEQYGGCLAAGRGFLHINPSGFAEPCPFAPLSDVNLRFSSLRDALASPLMEKIRSAHDLLTESEGGCALWANKEFVADLIHARTDSSVTQASQ